MSFTEYAVIIRKELGYRIVMATTVFMAICMIGLIVGIFWPSTYRSSTTVLIDQKKIIAPLLQGTTVPTGIQDRAALAQEVIFSREVLLKILAYGGWLDDDPSPIEIEQMMDKLKGRTSVTNVGKDLVRIEYKDSSPERAFKITMRFADLFISESQSDQRRESRQAFDFISGEVQRYAEKLKQSEERLNDYLAENNNIKPGTGAAVDANVNSLRQKIQAIETDLEEARIRKRSLESQLANESTTSYNITREAQILSMISDLQTQLQKLRLQYKETYPDIVTTKQKIATLESELKRNQNNDKPASASGEADIAGGVVLNPLNQQLRSDLAKEKTQIATLETRLKETKGFLQQEYQRGQSVAKAETRSSELTRDYEVNKSIYQDLLRRRESARIAMNMDAQNDGLNMTIQEPAALPVRPSGLRLIHFAIVTPLLAAAIVIGLLFLRIRTDDRIRSEKVIARDLGIPLLATIPPLLDAGARQRQQRLWTSAATAMGVIFLCYVIAGSLRLLRII
ncbi:MAG: hypothetical protein PVI56_07185 [Gammaproteobacteria bacterium]|jgi:polysaccharide chain length determinant protein (PEP-CTERM system associated)